MIDRLAVEAVREVRSGMVVGLGTGRAAARGVRALAERVRAEGLALQCVATSRATEELAGELGLRVVDLNSVPSGRVDFLFDGADEVDPDLSMIKGGGGAMTRERIVAHASAGRVYMIDSSKLTPRLGSRAKVPVEVLPIARLLIEHELTEELELEGEWRQRPLSGSGETTDYLTDNGNLVFDLRLPPSIAAEFDDLLELDGAIKTLPGVVDHGLFLVECDRVLIEWGDGRVENRAAQAR